MHENEVKGGNEKLNENGFGNSVEEKFNLDEIGECILVTAGPADFKEMEKSLIYCNEAMIAIGTLRMNYMMMLTRYGRGKLTREQLEKKCERSCRDPRLIFREVIDLDSEGLLIDGEVPAIWVHLGHGHSEDGVSSISPSDDETDEFLPTERILSHLKGGEGKMWFALMPVCHGRAIAGDLEQSEKIISAWGSVSEKPQWSWDELVEFIQWSQSPTFGEHRNSKRPDSKAEA